MSHASTNSPGRSPVVGVAGGKAIAELIHEALEANEKKWELIRQVVKREN